jgi:hypothetical protein
VVRAVVAGGGAYHALATMQSRLPFQDVVMCPDPDAANVFGAYTLLRLKDQQGR